MSIKYIITLTLFSFFFIGCQDAYQRQSALNPMGVFMSNSAQKDVDSVSRTQNPMTRPSYNEYKESIKDKKFEPK
jgi:hypothetical protein